MNNSSYDVKRNILIKTNYEDIAKWCQTNTEYHNICSNPTFWFDKAKIDFNKDIPIVTDIEGEERDILSSKEQYLVLLIQKKHWPNSYNIMRELGRTGNIRILNSILGGISKSANGLIVYGIIGLFEAGKITNAELLIKSMSFEAPIGNHILDKFREVEEFPYILTNVIIKYNRPKLLWFFEEDIFPLYNWEDEDILFKFKLYIEKIRHFTILSREKGPYPIDIEVIDGLKSVFLLSLDKYKKEIISNLSAIKQGQETILEDDILEDEWNEKIKENIGIMLEIIIKTECFIDI